MQLMQLVGVASSFVSALVLALYVQSQMPSGAAQRPTVAWIIVPLVLFGNAAYGCRRRAAR